MAAIIAVLTLLFFITVPGTLQWDITVLFGRSGLSLGAQEIQGLDDGGPGVPRPDDGVNEAPSGGDIRVAEKGTILLDLFPAFGLRIGGLPDLASVDDIDG